MAVYTDPTIITSSSTKKTNIGYYIALGAGVLSIIIGGLFYYLTQDFQNKNTDLDSQIALTDTEIGKLRGVSESLKDYDAMSNNLANIFTNQKDWPAILDTLQDRLYKKMVVTSFQIDDKGQVSLSGKVGSYVDYAKFYSAMTDPNNSKYVTKAKVLSVIKSSKDPKVADSIDQVTFTYKFSLGTAAMTAVSYENKLAKLNGIIESKTQQLNSQANAATRDQLNKQILSLNEQKSTLEKEVAQLELTRLQDRLAGYKAEAKELSAYNDSTSLERIALINSSKVPELELAIQAQQQVINQK